MWGCVGLCGAVVEQRKQKKGKKKRGVMMCRELRLQLAHFCGAARAMRDSEKGERGRRGRRDNRRGERERESAGGKTGCGGAGRDQQRRQEHGEGREATVCAAAAHLQRSAAETAHGSGGGGGGRGHDQRQQALRRDKVRRSAQALSRGDRSTYIYAWQHGERPASTSEVSQR